MQNTIEFGDCRETMRRWKEQGVKAQTCVGAWRDEWSHFVNGLRIVVAADNDEAGRTLEQRIRNSVKSPVTFVRATHGDLTEIANELGLESLRALLLTGLGELPEATPRTLDESTALLLAYFPEACEVRS